MKKLRMDEDRKQILVAVERILAYNTSKVLVGVDVSVYEDKSAVLTVYLKDARGRAIAMGSDRYLTCADDDALDELCTMIEKKITEHNEQYTQYLKDKEECLLEELAQVRGLLGEGAPDEEERAD